MSEFNGGGGKQWNMYSGSLNSDPSQTIINKDGEAPWRSSMNAISFGFLATALLISMFLIMAIFEHLFRQSSESSSDEESRQMQKLRTPEVVQTSHASDFSVVMPGQQYPTFIAQPAPLAPRREGVHWTSHHQHSSNI